EEAARPDAGDAARRGGAVDGGALPDDGPRADLDPRLFVPVPDVLRGATEHRAGGNPDARPEPDVALQHRVWSQQAAVPDLHLRTDDRIGTDLHLVPQFRARVHDRGRMHGRQGHLSTTQAIISASVTTCPSTVATPFIR